MSPVGPGKWFRKRVSSWEELGAVCNNGSPYAYYVSPGSGENVNRWLLFLKGGGEAPSDDSVATRWAQQRSLMTQRVLSFKPSSNAGTNQGVFARDVAGNHFADWTYVYLHYCSSDLHSGTRSGADHPTRLWYRGRVNVEAVVEELLEGIDLPAGEPALPAMAEATQVVVSGASAGAAGARMVMDWVADQVHKVNPSAETLGLADSVFVPRVHPLQFHETDEAGEFWGTIHDADCIEAHPDQPGLCKDHVHTTTGLGAGVHFGAVDDGHLGVPGADEGAAVSGVFTFMALCDGNSFSKMGKFGWCVVHECDGHADCAAGQGCIANRCYTIEPCEAAACPPGSGACYGLDDPDMCLGEVATRPGECNDDAECPGGVGCCGDGEQCFFGNCRQVGYEGCGSPADCPPGHGCSGGFCTLALVEPDPADQDPPPACPAGYIVETDQGLCQLPPGCTGPDGGNPCGQGYTCVPAAFHSITASLEWGIRDALATTSNDDTPRQGAYAPLSKTHTAMTGGKYYGSALPKVDGKTFDQVLAAWMSDAPDYAHHVARPMNVPAPLWAEQVVSFTADGISTTTTGTGCDSEAIAFVLCDATGVCEGPEDALAIATVGDAGASSTLGSLVTGTQVPLLVAIVANPECTSPVLATSLGDHLALTYVSGVDGSELTRRIALPVAALGDGVPLPLALHVGADGALWTDPAFTGEPVSRRLD